MKRIVVLIALAFALVTGTAVVLTVHPQPAVADCSNGNC
jgi:hypothetical protein